MGCTVCVTCLYYVPPQRGGASYTVSEGQGPLSMAELAGPVSIQPLEYGDAEHVVSPDQSAVSVTGTQWAVGGVKV